jgi:glyoxylase-like metal-dependent hydrolase (beta-lactamase superfamily II)
MTDPVLFLEVLRAEHGDCLMLHHGDDIVLIDGGPSGVYKTTLKPRLEELMATRPQPLFLQMVMVSHIDDDHIIGLAEMFAEAVDRKENKTGPPRWTAGELWLNAFGALTGASPTAGAGDARGAALNDLATTAPGEETKAIAAGVKSGIALHEDAIALGVDRNSSVEGDLIRRGGPKATIDVVPGLTFTVLAPDQPRLEKLRTKWEKWEQDHPVQEAANLDRSVFNLSSIVVLARSENRTLLLTGDARSDDIIAGLEAEGLLTDVKPLMVDVLKLPHHGSIRNVDKTFFARVRARNYVISANGRDGNPENETLTLLCDSRLNDDDAWTLWLTYGAEAGDGKPGFHERLDAFFTDRRAKQNLDVRIAKPGERHTIALD